MENQKIKVNSKRGFTLIELLVVVAIVGLLSTVGVVATGSARLKARDVRRLSDNDQLKKALALYYDNHSSYPTSSEATCVSSLGSCSSCPCSSANWDSNSGLYQAIVTNDKLMTSLPIDPINNSNRYYRYIQKTINSKSCYLILARYETGKHTPKCYDLNGDSYFTTADYTLFYNQYWGSPAEGNPRYNGMVDYNSDGRVNDQDMTIFLAHLGDDEYGRNFCWVCE